MDYNTPIQYWYMDNELDSTDIRTIYKMYFLQKEKDITIRSISDLEIMIARELGKELVKAFMLPLKSKKDKKK